MSAAKAAKAAERAEAALVAAEELHTRWCAELDARRAELDGLRARAGELLLDDPDAAGRLAEQETRLAVAVRQAEQAVDAAAGRVPPLRRQVVAARAGLVAARAAALAAAAERRQARTDELLAALAEWEGGARYVPWEPSTVDVQHGRDVLPGLAGSGVRYKIPLTEVVRRQAAKLKAEAARLAKVAESGDDAAVSRAVGGQVPAVSEIERAHAGV